VPLSSGSGAVAWAIALLFGILVPFNLFNALWLFVSLRWLRVPPLRITVGMGPEIFARHLSGIAVVIRAFPISSSAEYVHDDQEAKQPGFLSRLLVALGPIALLVAFGTATLGPDAMYSLASGFSQILQLCWPTQDGVNLVTAFAELVQSDGAMIGAAVLAMKYAAFGLLLYTLEPLRWVALQKSSTAFLVIVVLTPMLASIGIVITLLRAVL
jgi:hypothetical protein